MYDLVIENAQIIDGLDLGPVTLVGEFIRPGTYDPAAGGLVDPEGRWYWLDRNPPDIAKMQAQMTEKPDGPDGEVTVAIDAKVDQGTGLVTTLEREVTTRLGDSTRVTIETWTLSPKG